MSPKTLKYILKRIGLAILTVWVVITVTFFVMHAVPGGPFMSEKAVSPAAQAALEAKYGLDKPLLEQYFTYLKDVVTRFDFGPSLKQRGRMVIDIIRELRDYGIEPAVCDPCADADEAQRLYSVSLVPLEAVKAKDAVIISVAHNEFRALTEEVLDGFFCDGKKVLIDVKGLYDRAGLEQRGYAYWRL